MAMRPYRYVGFKHFRFAIWCDKGVAVPISFGKSHKGSECALAAVLMGLVPLLVALIIHLTQ